MARRLGVSRQRVSQLKQAGKLETQNADINVEPSLRRHQERLAAQQTSPSRQIKDRYEAKTAKFEYERLMGHWMEKTTVERDAFRIGRQIRDGLMSLPDRLAMRLAAEPSADKIRDILLKEFLQILEALARPAPADGRREA